MCGGGADETPHGLRVFEGAWADGYLGRYPVRPGYAFVIWKGRHVRGAHRAHPEEAAGFWSDVARVARAVEEQYQPAKMNWLSLGNGVPHLHVHLVPRPPRGRTGRASARDGGLLGGHHAGHGTGAAGEGGGGAACAVAAVTMRELLAEGRTAEVFAYGEGTVLKLDRPDWNGLAEYEGGLLSDLADAGLPVARRPRHRHRRGTQRRDPRPRRRALARRHAWPGAARTRPRSWPSASPRSRRRATRVTVEGLPDLVPRLRGEIEAVVDRRRAARRAPGLLAGLDDGGRGVCHYDFHPANVLVGPNGWVVIDWLTVAAGPSAADLARTLVLWGRQTGEPVVTFLPRRATERPGAARPRRRRRRRLGPHRGRRRASPRASRARRRRGSGRWRPASVRLFA